MTTKRWRNLARPSAALALGLIALACSNDADVRTHVKAIESACPRGQECEIVLQFPTGVNGENLAVSASEGIIIGSGTELTAADGQFADIATSTGEIRVESSSGVGTVSTSGHVFVGSQSTIHGKLFASSTEVQSGASAPGVLPYPGEPNKIKWNVTFPSASGDSINLEPAQTRNLDPGNYGALRVASRSTVTLTTGTYYFDTLQLEPDSILEVDTTGGTVVINVRGELTHRGRLISLGSPSDIIVVMLGTGRAELGDEFDGTLVAPYAEVSIARPRSGAHDAQIFGRKVSIQGGVQLSATIAAASGPAIDGLGATFEPSGDVELPVPAPVFDGQTPEEWDAEREAFINALLEADYVGPPVDLPPHPDATKSAELSDFSLPAGTSVSVLTSPEIAPRTTAIRQETDEDAEPWRMPIESADADDPTAAWHIPEAEAEFQEDIEESEEVIYDKPGYEFLDQQDGSDGVYGTDAKVEEVPRGCYFSANNQTLPDPDDFDYEVHSGGNPFAFDDVVDPVVLGNKPAYLSKSTDPQKKGQYVTNGASRPLFDGYWFFEANAMAGWNGVGMEGQISAGSYAGIVALKEHAELMRVYIDANGAILKQFDDRIEPHFSSRLDTAILGKNRIFGRDLPNWNFDSDDPQASIKAKTKVTLLDAAVPMFPEGTAPRLQVGPFALILNGGAQVKIPLALDLDAQGPEVTLSPMFRVYITIFAGVDVAIAKLGVEGEADLIRVDMPFKAKVKWRDYREPEACFSSADFNVTYQTVWSTLNGKISVTVSGRVPLVGEVKLVDYQVASWDGPTWDSGEINLLPTVQFPLQELPPAECRFGGTSCKERAAPDWTVNQVPDFQDITEYDNPECRDQYVIEVPISNSGSGARDMYMFRQFLPDSITSAAECLDSQVEVRTYRKVNGNWEDAAPGYTVYGDWSDGACQALAAGYIADGQPNLDYAYPYSWFGIVPGTTEVRIVIAGGTECQKRSLQVGVLDSL